LGATFQHSDNNQLSNKEHAKMDIILPAAVFKSSKDSQSVISHPYIWLHCHNLLWSNIRVANLQTTSGNLFSQLYHRRLTEVSFFQSSKCFKSNVLKLCTFYYNFIKWLQMVRTKSIFNPAHLSSLFLVLQNRERECCVFISNWKLGFLFLKHTTFYRGRICFLIVMT